MHLVRIAQPREGSSAGIAFVVGIVSALTGRPVKPACAMTGEVTLTGLVLPVGGIKEKVLAAHRAGIRQIILPKENQKDLRDVPETVRRDLKFVFAERMEDVLQAAIPKLTPRAAELAVV